ncbi:hypothetical protein N7466_000443 [Penicillium verhagenii]|uniref:uncharacterized protein n=1 Tax=Penicillium verhagenii TaxID=1562060 RepID=UPI0025456C3E|nr:uncharacterized protein N7466_000443 [Penicillium verhagenii]KAJ5947428.1 hypothetical protein N7466_000443 [Penicillium verhagenii]
MAPHHLVPAKWALLAFLSVYPDISLAKAVPRGSTSCRYIPGDAGWPTVNQWQALNASVSGRLIATNPIAHVCHDPTYSEAECEYLQKEWGIPSLQVPEPAEILAPYFLNQSCDPYTTQSQPCVLDNYVSYSINVTGVADVVAGVEFAETHNIRLVIKNTGHDFLGKSTGKGGLALWTHDFNDIELITNYSSSYYKGPALKVGAGVMGGDALLAASEQGYRVVVGSCPTVGMTGGYTQGGGHSLLSGLYGLAADNVLEWEVVTADGTHLIATPTSHADLFWALGGGGGGTYGVVISMTVRLFEDGSVGRASLIFTSTITNGTDAFWNAVDVFQSHLPAIVDDHGIVVTYVVSNDTLDLYVATAPNRTADQVAEIFEPMTSALATLGLSASAIDFTTAVADTYYDHYLATLEPVLASAQSDQITSGRIVSRENMATNGSSVTAAMRTATAGGSMDLLCSAMNTTNGVASVGNTAIQPAWNTALVSCVISETWDWTKPWDYMLERQAYLTTVVDPAFMAATPGSGTYLNEANFQQADWQTAFYGTNYARLESIKAKYDPKSLLYGLTAVGSEAWEEDSYGRLCRTDA